jgi:hypothetical protein
MKLYRLIKNVLSETRIFVKRIFNSEWYRTKRRVTSIRLKLCVTVYESHYDDPGK